MTNVTTAIPVPVLLIATLTLFGLTAYLLVQGAIFLGLDGIRNTVYRYMLKAEHIFTKTDGGKRKMTYVVKNAHALLPAWCRMFISEAALRKIIQTWFDGVKDLLDDGKVNGSQDYQSATDHLDSLSDFDNLDDDLDND